MASFRPMRAPLGVKPRAGPLAEPLPPPAWAAAPATGASPSCSRVLTACGAAGRAPLTMAEPGVPAAGIAGAPRGPGSRPRHRLARGSTVSAREGRGTGRKACRDRRIAARGGRRLAGDGDTEDGARDAVADEVAEFLVKLERLAPELVERVLLRVAAQADAAAHVVDLGQVLHPERIDGPQQDHALDGAPVGRADLGFAGVQAASARSSRCSLIASRRAEVPQLVGARALAGQAHHRRGRRPGRRCPTRAGRRRRGGRATSVSISSSMKPRIVSVRSSLCRTLSRSA